jgi:hypothetical protein
MKGVDVETTGLHGRLRIDTISLRSKVRQGNCDNPLNAASALLPAAAQPHHVAVKEDLNSPYPAPKYSSVGTLMVRSR